MHNGWSLQRRVHLYHRSNGDLEFEVAVQPCLRKSGGREGKSIFNALGLAGIQFNDYYYLTICLGGVHNQPVL